MRFFRRIVPGVALAVLAAGGLHASRTFAETVTTKAASSPANAQFEDALTQVENLHLPLNRAYLYRQAAGVFAQKDPKKAVGLLKQSLAEIDAGEAAMRSQSATDDALTRQLAAGRRSTMLQIVRLDLNQALRLLGPPQTADSDADLQRQVFEQLGARDVRLAHDFAIQKLDFSVTPAVVAGYESLRRRDAGWAKDFAAAIVTRLQSIDPAQNPVAAESAFALLRLQRIENGGRESRGNAAASLLDADSLRELYEFIGRAFLEAQDTEALKLVEKPAAYMTALQQFAPEQAKELTDALAVSAADAKTTPASSSDTNQSTTAAPTAEEQKQLDATRAAIQARLAAQVRESLTHIRLLSARVRQTTLTQKERDDAVFGVVDEANRSISLARALDRTLDNGLVPEAFRDGEFEFYSAGPLTGVVDEVSSVLQRYAVERPAVAEDAASRLDGPEVQAEVELQIAMRVLRGGVDRFGQGRSFGDRRRGDASR